MNRKEGIPKVGHDENKETEDGRKTDGSSESAEPSN